MIIFVHRVFATPGNSYPATSSPAGAAATSTPAAAAATAAASSALARTVTLGAAAFIAMLPALNTQHGCP